MNLNKAIRQFSIRAIIVLLFALSLYFCANTFASFIRPHLVSKYVLAAKYEDGSYTEYTYKTTSLLEYIGKAADVVLGGDFTDVAAVAGAISANLTYDEEHTSYIEDMPLAEKKDSGPVLEKTVSSGGGKTVSGSITVNNETSYEVSDAELSSTKPLFFAGESEKPQVLIVHSHSTESYTPSEKYQFTHTAEDRTTDTDYNMIRIGKELKKELEKRDIKSVHITKLFDYPKYDNSYSRSCDAVLDTLEKNPQIKIVLDLHRDSIINSEGVKTKLTTTINGEKAAQVMLVVGTDELGLKHDNWRTNLGFAAQLQKYLLLQEENFARPINLRTSRFNGHTAPGAVIVEVGTGGNTIDEALVSVKYIANAVENLLNDYEKTA